MTLPKGMTVKASGAPAGEGVFLRCGICRQALIYVWPEAEEIPIACMTCAPYVVSEGYLEEIEDRAAKAEAS